VDRAHRLTRGADYRHVRTVGKSWSEPLAVVQAAPRDGATRIGLVVGKRIGKAHDRNKAKRRLRAICCRWLPNLKVGYDIVCIARSGIPIAEYTQLESAMERLFTRASLVGVAATRQ
jgi:ribonuclease P protein component